MEKHILLPFVVNVNDLPFILGRIIVFPGPRKVLDFTIQLKLVAAGTVSRNVIMCCRGQ